MSGSADPSVVNAQAMSPLAIPTYICDWSLYGTWTIFVPVACSNAAEPRCDGLPTYDDPYVTPPAFAFAAATSASTFG